MPLNIIERTISGEPDRKLRLFASSWQARFVLPVAGDSWTDIIIGLRMTLGPSSANVPVDGTTGIRIGLCNHATQGLFDADNGQTNSLQIYGSTSLTRNAGPPLYYSSVYATAVSTFSGNTSNNAPTTGLYMSGDHTVRNPVLIRLRKVDFEGKTLSFVLPANAATAQMDCSYDALKAAINVNPGDTTIDDFKSSLESSLAGSSFSATSNVGVGLDEAVYGKLDSIAITAKNQFIEAEFSEIIMRVIA